MMLLLAGLLSWSRLALAQEHLLPDCTEARLSGPYAYSRMGTVVGRGPAAANGVVTFDGHGQLTGTDTASMNGKITTRDFTGAYKVTPECTGTATFFFSDRERVTLALQLLAGAQAVQFIQTDAGTVITGVAKAQGSMSHRAAVPVEAGEPGRVATGQLRAEGFTDFEGCYNTCQKATLSCAAGCGFGNSTCLASCSLGFHNCVTGCNELYPVVLEQ
jgi:hypothetical protein